MNRQDEISRAKPWTDTSPPNRILVIRLQALGDTFIALPWINSLRAQFPFAQIDFLILKKNADLPGALILFDQVLPLSGSTAKWQFLYGNLLLPWLIVRRYDVVIDLQRNRISRWIRFWMFPRAWSEIERFSRSFAGEKFQNGVAAAGFGKMDIGTSFKLRNDKSVGILKRAGWNGINKLVVLNPAGAFVTRNWPLESYRRFAVLWLRSYPDSTFLFLGIDRIEAKAKILSAEFSHQNVVNLTNRLTPPESFSVIRHAHFVLTEDSALMHMAWVQQIPTLALFGSSPSYWSAPMGAWSKCLSSSDLPCGDCLAATCRFGDVHCMTRYTPEMVLETAQQLLRSIKQ